MALTETAGAAFATSSGTDTVTTGSYSPTAGTLQVAIIGCGNGDGETYSSATLTDTSGSGSWTLLESATANAVGMGWVYARAAWSGAATVTFTVVAVSGTVGDLCIITRQFAGAAAIGSQPGVIATVSSTSAIQNLSITPGTTGSQVVGGCGTSAGAVVLVANGTTTIYGQTDAGSFGDVEACIKATSLSTSGTPISMGFTNTAKADWGFALAEIKPASVVTAAPAGIYLRQAIGAASLW
jgi:hypothetical protein